jgi:hypothetical protein
MSKNDWNTEDAPKGWDEQGKKASNTAKQEISNVAEDKDVPKEHQLNFGKTAQIVPQYFFNYTGTKPFDPESVSGFIAENLPFIGKAVKATPVKKEEKAPAKKAVPVKKTPAKTSAKKPTSKKK